MRVDERPCLASTSGFPSRSVSCRCRAEEPFEGYPLRCRIERCPNRVTVLAVERYIEMAGERFNLFARAISRFCASALATVLAFITILAWAVSGPYFHFSSNWQVTIGTG